MDSTATDSQEQPMSRAAWWWLWIGVCFGAIGAAGSLYWLFVPEQREEYGLGTLLISIVAGALIAILCFRKVRGIPLPSKVSRPEQHPGGSAAGATRKATAANQNDDWQPDRPTGKTFTAWGPPVDRVEVAGTWYRQGAFGRLFADNPDFATRGASTSEAAVLVPDPNNPHSKNGNAVAVYVCAIHVGYLPSAVAEIWGPVLRGLSRENLNLIVKCSTYARLDHRRKEEANVVVQLPAPSALLPDNSFPSGGYIEIPAGRKRQITRGDEHMDVLRSYVDNASQTYLVATLRVITDVRPRSAREIVEVSLNGQPVGMMTDLQSKNFIALVRYIEDRGKIPVVRAMVEGTPLKADAVIWAQDASEVDPKWIAGLGPKAEKPAEVIPGPDWDWDWDDDR